jgi:hypothetical protein
VLDVGDPKLLAAGRPGRIVLEAAEELVVENEEARDRLIASGAEPTKVRVLAPEERPSWRGRRTAERQSARGSEGERVPVLSDIPEAADRATIQRWVRDRAAAMSDRRANPGLHDGDPAAAVRALPYLVLPVPPDTAKGRVARVVARLTTWQLRPIIEHVNRLQYAAVEALDALRLVERDRRSRDQRGEEPFPD